LLLIGDLQVPLLSLEEAAIGFEDDTASMDVHADDGLRDACTDDIEHDLTGMGTWVECTLDDDIAFEVLDDSSE
jgi:hypothetical protein